MAIIQRGPYSFEDAIERIVDKKHRRSERQCAWELYTEISTRVAVVGKCQDPGATDFSGEVFVQSLDSLSAFFQATRAIMKAFPVGETPDEKSQHLGIFMGRITIQVIRPFLEKWQADFRHWYETRSDSTQAPFERQEAYDRIEEFKGEWTNIRIILREVRQTLLNEYGFVDFIQSGKNGEERPSEP